MTGTRYPILGIVPFHRMGVLQDFSASRQAYDQFAQLADVLDAALAASQHSLLPVRIPNASCQSM